MPGIINTATRIIDYWWFRYLMMTELYIVEKWERVTISILFKTLPVFLNVLLIISYQNNFLTHSNLDIIFAILFILFWYFNYSMVYSSSNNSNVIKHSAIPQLVREDVISI